MPVTVPMLTRPWIRCITVSESGVLWFSRFSDPIMNLNHAKKTNFYVTQHLWQMYGGPSMLFSEVLSYLVLATVYTG